MKSPTTISNVRNLITISLIALSTQALSQVTAPQVGTQNRSTMELQMVGGNGCPKTSVKIIHSSPEELELSIPALKASATGVTSQSKSCRLSLAMQNGENRQFAVVGASFNLKAKLENGTNSRVTLETYAQGIDPETKTSLVFTGPKEVNETVTTRHEAKWSACSGGRLFNTGLSIRMGKVGGGPATGTSEVEVTGPIKLKLKWRDCAVSASL